MLDLGRSEHLSPTSRPVIHCWERRPRWTNLVRQGAARRLGGEATMEFLMQPINRTLLEEVDENNTAMDPVHYPVSTPPVVQLPARSASSADVKICAEMLFQNKLQSTPSNRLTQKNLDGRKECGLVQLHLAGRLVLIEFLH